MLQKQVISVCLISTIMTLETVVNMTSPDNLHNVKRVIMEMIKEV